jgi:hypothetical protein
VIEDGTSNYIGSYIVIVKHDWHHSLAILGDKDQVLTTRVLACLQRLIMLKIGRWHIDELLVAKEQTCSNHWCQQELRL